MEFGLQCVIVALIQTISVIRTTVVVVSPSVKDGMSFLTSLKTWDMLQQGVASTVSTTMAPILPIIADGQLQSNNPIT